MASSKDVYEAGVYKSNVYAAGVYRGTGVTVVLVYGPMCVTVARVHIPGPTKSVMHIPGPTIGKGGC